MLLALQILTCHLLEVLDFCLEFLKFLFAAFFYRSRSVLCKSLIFSEFFVELILKGFEFGVIFLTYFLQ